MGAIWGLVVRNLKVYIRDRAAVFFSFLSMLIIIGLYALFLGKAQVSSIKHVTGDLEGVRFLVDSWIMGGLLAVNSVTVGLGVLATMVQDNERKNLHDFLVAPVRRSQIVASYLLTSWLIGIALNMVALIIGQVYIVAGGGELLSGINMVKVIGLIILCVGSSSAILFFMVSFIRSMNAFGALSTILGTMIGFITGVFVPLSLFPDAVRGLVTFVPVSHGAALLRQVFMERPMEIVFGNAPPEVVNRFMDNMGSNLYIGSHRLNVTGMIGMLVIPGLLFLGLSVMRLRMLKSGS